MDLQDQPHTLWICKISPKAHGAKRIAQEESSRQLAVCREESVKGRELSAISLQL
jgi:hypothetical protein